MHLKCFSCSLSHPRPRPRPLSWMVESAEPAQPRPSLVQGGWVLAGTGQAQGGERHAPSWLSFSSPLHANAWSTWQLAKRVLHLLSCVLFSKILEKGLGRDYHLIFYVRFREVMADRQPSLALNSRHSTLKLIIFPLCLSACTVRWPKLELLIFLSFLLKSLSCNPKKPVSITKTWHFVLWLFDTLFSFLSFFF